MHLGFAVLVKYFELEERFPRHAGDVPRQAVVHVAAQIRLEPDLVSAYAWSGRHYPVAPRPDSGNARLSRVHRRGRGEANRLAGRSGHTPTSTGLTADTGALGLATTVHGHEIGWQPMRERWS